MKRKLLINVPELEVEWEILFGAAVFHLKLKTKWTHTIKKRFLVGMEEVKKAFKENGFDWLYVIAHELDSKLIKFHKSLGFEPCLHLDNGDNRKGIVSRISTNKDKKWALK